ncbi:MAG: transposase [Oscillospiraceae bacterium]|nr:transposase [Oscillospiraceae bacterium]MBR4655937.1 transposase [Oscillospiraceae bacterium]
MIELHLSRVDGYTYLEQTSWSNYNESCDLKATVEHYRRKFGFYPEAVLADKIYQTRENRRYCKALGIRLSGPPLGRKRTGEAGAKESRQMRKDACERNGIESSNGVAKRKYGLDLIMSKLDETAKTEAALVILAMNAAHRLRRWLLRFFNFWGLDVVFQ